MLGDDLPAARPAEQASAWREGLHPRHAKGSEKGGEFAPKTAVRRSPGRAAVAPGKKVWVANLTPEQRAANLDALKAAKTKPVSGVTRLKIPGGVTTQEIPRQWLVDNGYAVPSSRGRLYDGDGVIQLKRDVDQEAILVHYLSGKKPENYPVGTKGFDQFMYGRQLPAGASKEARERMRTIRAKNKGERETVIRRITAALVAAGIEEMEAHALVAAAFVETDHPRHKKGSEKGGQFAPKGARDEAAQRAVEAGKAARARGASESEVAEAAYQAMYPKPDVRREETRVSSIAQRNSAPLERAWEPGTAMAEIEDMHYATNDDAELGRMVREYYRKRTSELGETKKRSPGV